MSADDVGAGALVSVLTMRDVALHWRTYLEGLSRDIDGLSPADVYDASLWVVLVGLGVVTAISISTAFVSWWARDQEITLQTTLLSLAVDILVLLALSSRSAAAYARRAEKH
ncbi:hypothetical protein [Microbacterium lacticum]|uniref:hypothetical protein n=1 Tax=Microbacterium lacticum TaxID=33885 RepID=UPI0028D259D6|nr:hypothetical protein [Microbacterium lacticum]